MYYLGLLRAVTQFHLDLYICEALPWRIVAPFVFSYSMTCAAAAVVYSQNGPDRGCSARRKTGDILLNSLSHTPPRMDSLSATQPCVYMIFSLWHSHRYIGSTNNFGRRMREHIRAALLCSPLFSKVSNKDTTATQRVHNCLGYLGVSHFCMIPLCNTSIHDLRRVELIYIQRLQPSLNVKGTSRNGVPSHNMKSQAPTLWNGTRAPNRDNPALLAARLRRAHTHVMEETLGTALPSSVGRLCLALRQTAKGHMTGDTDGNISSSENLCQALRAFPRTRSSLLDPAFCEKDQPPTATRTLFRIRTRFTCIITAELAKDWGKLLLECPVSELTYGFCAITCSVTISRFGSLATRYNSNVQRHVWSPLVHGIRRDGSSQVTSLGCAIRDLEMGTVIQMTTFLTSPPLRGDPDMVLILYDIGRNPSRIHWTLRNFSPADTLKVWRSCCTIQSKSWRATVRGAICHHMNKTWGMKPNARPTIRIPCMLPAGNGKKFEALCLSMINMIPMEPIFIRTFKERIRFVTTSGQSIASMLSNNIGFAKHINKGKPVCTCSAIKQTLMIPIHPSSGHIAQRASACINGDAAHIFRTNATSIPFPGRQDIDGILVKTIKELYRTLVRWLGRTISKPVHDSMDIQLAVAAGMAVIPDWSHLSHIQEIVNTAMLCHYIPGTLMWDDIQNTRCGQRTQSNTEQGNSRGFPTTGEVKQLQRELRKIAVVSTLDRNPGALFIECPVTHHAALLQTFMGENNGTYTVMGDDTSQETIMSVWKTMGVRHGAPGVFDRKGVLPYAYISRKNKDTARFRPIVSFSRAPHRLQLRRIAQAFNFILQQLESTNFTLWNATNVRSRLLEMGTTMSSHPMAAGQGVEIVGTTADIKDMYTCLPHEDIIRAVEWSITKFSSKTRRTSVNIKRYGKARGRTGPVYNTSSRVEISCSTVAGYIRDALRSCFFTCGIYTLQQVVGIPMGSHVSPPLAIATCMYSEDLYMSSRAIIERPIAGLRYIDDILLMSLRRIQCTLEKQEEENAAVRSTFSEGLAIYPPQLRVLITATAQPLPFLETEVGWIGSRTLLTYRNGNAAALAATGKQKIQRFRHGSSFATPQSLRAVAQCMLRRTTFFNTTLGCNIESIMQLLHEFNSLGYPHQLLCKAVHRLIRSDYSNAALWELISMIMKRFLM